MKITVIVTTYDLIRFNDTIAAVDSLLAQTYNETEIVVVVDRNETLYSKLNQVLPSKVKIVLSEAGGLSNSRNTGIEFSNGDIIAFMDDDAVADPNWLSNLVQNYCEPEVVGVGGKIKPLWLGNEDTWFPEELYWIIGCTYKGYSSTRCEVRNNFGGNLSFRRGVFDKVVFSAAMGRNGNIQLTADDTEFSVRSLQEFKGSKIIYDPEAVVYHRIYPYRLTTKYILKRAFGDGVSKAYISMKYTGRALATENTYLKGLIVSLMRGEPTRASNERNSIRYLKRFALKLSVIIIVAVGYLQGKSKWRGHI